MGAIAVWIAEHAKLLAAWAVIVAATSALLYAVVQSDAWKSIAEAGQGAVEFLDLAATYAPRQVSSINGTISAALEADDGIGGLMFYCAGASNAVRIIEFIVLNVSALLSALAGLAVSAFVLVAAGWVARRLSQFAVVLSGGRSGGVMVAD